MAETTISKEMINSAKSWLRITTDSRNEEIRQVMSACLIDLRNGGVKKIDIDDKLIQQAMKLFLKSQFGYDSNAEKFAESYEFLKRALALSGDYNTANTAEADNGMAE